MVAQSLTTSLRGLRILAAVAVVLPLLAANNIFAGGDLSARLFGRSYPVTQDYLNRSSLNPTPDGLHAGIDYGAPAGTIIRAVRGGQVLTAGNSYRTVAVFDGQNTVIYLHLRKIYARVDQKIGEGTQIGEAVALARLAVERISTSKCVAEGIRSRFIQRAASLLPSSH